MPTYHAPSVQIAKQDLQQLTELDLSSSHSIAVHSHCIVCLMLCKTAKWSSHHSVTDTAWLAKLGLENLLGWNTIDSSLSYVAQPEVRVFKRQWSNLER